MTDIICPNCNTAFKIDESGYSEILKQVRDEQFNDEIKKRLDIAEKEKQSAVELAKSQIQNELNELVGLKDKELSELKAKNETEMTKQIASKDAELLKIKAELNNVKLDRESAIQLAQAETEKRLREELNKLQNELSSFRSQSQLELTEKLTQKDSEILQMKATISQFETVKQLAITEAKREIEKQRDELSSDLKSKEIEKQLLEKSLNEKHQSELKTKDDIIRLKDEEIELRKDMKLKLSTKMVGETLEQHCENEFNKLRATAFQNAYFEKDNDSKTGSKGDYIYKESDEHENEIISIMFEMKNENEQTATKKKNEDFFKELDKDRQEKGCEYAVLVSLLESENEFYNQGIVDVSHKYPKMYVIRPQFFIPIITLLRNAAMNSLEYKAELNMMRNQNIDITNFEEKITNFRDGFAKNYISASNHFEKAIEEIDKSINRMMKVKSELTTSANQLRLANQKAEGLTIKKLTYNNPTMKDKFNDLKKDK